MFDRLSIHASRPLATALGAALCALALQAQASTPSGMVPPASEASGMVQQFAQDVVRSADAEGRTFGVIDKPSATLWIFDAQGRTVASSPVLVGQAVGDVHRPTSARARCPRSSCTRK